MSVAKNLMAGRIVDENLFPYPRLRDKDREVLGDDGRGDRPVPGAEASRISSAGTATAAQPPELIQGLRDLGLFGLIIPEEHGGLGLSNAGYARVLRQSSRTTVRCRSPSARTVRSA